jgi:hypothetical protein
MTKQNEVLNVVEVFKRMTRCEDCVHAEGPRRQGGGLYDCVKYPEGVVDIVNKRERCDSGLWLWKTEHGLCLAMGIKDWIQSPEGSLRKRATVISRSEWPKG